MRTVSHSNAEIYRTLPLFIWSVNNSGKQISKLAKWSIDGQLNVLNVEVRHG
jgi:hypothetical protein